MMSDWASLAELLRAVAEIPHLLMIVGTTAIIAITIAVSGQRSLLLRLVYLCLLAGCVYLLARQLPDLNGDFFLNISTELIGAMAVLMILGNQVARHRWLILVIVILIIGLTIPVGLLDEDSQAIGLNLSAELVGAFIIFILLQHREWLWNIRDSAHEREKAAHRQRRAKLRRQYEDALQAQREQEQDQMQQAMQAEMARWRVEDAWDIAIKVTAPDKTALRHKVMAIRATLRDARLCQFREDAEHQYAECYVLARVMPPAVNGSLRRDAAPGRPATAARAGARGNRPGAAGTQ